MDGRGQVGNASAQNRGLGIAEQAVCGADDVSGTRISREDTLMDDVVQALTEATSPARKRKLSELAGLVVTPGADEAALRGQLARYAVRGAVSDDAARVELHFGEGVGDVHSRDGEEGKRMRDVSEEVVVMFVAPLAVSVTVLHRRIEEELGLSVPLFSLEGHAFGAKVSSGVQEDRMKAWLLRNGCKICETRPQKWH